MLQKYQLYALAPLIASILCITAGGFGLCIWTEYSTYMTTPGLIPADVAPFDIIDVLALTLFTVATPIGFMLLIHFVTFLIRELSYNPNKSSQSLSFLFYMLIIAITIGSFGMLSYESYRWSRHVLRCGFIMCIDQEKWPHPDDGKVSKFAEGFKSTIAAPLIAISTALSITLVLILFREIHRRCTSNGTKIEQQHQRGDIQTPLLESVNSDHITSLEINNPNQVIKATTYTPFNTYYQITRTKTGAQVPLVANTKPAYMFKLTLFVIFIILSFLTILFFSSYIPNSFRYYWPRVIANMATLKVTNKTLECIQKGAFSCPEKLDATFQTKAIEINPNLILKLFPSNMIFYSFVLIAIIFPFITRLIPPIDNFLQTKVVVGIPTLFFWHYARRKSLLSFSKTYWSVYEILLSLWMTLGTFLFFFYWFQDHNWKQRWPGSDVTTFWDTLYRSTGQVAVVLLSLLMFPVARTSPILQLLGVSWDKGINFHRWGGVAFMVMTFIHMITSYISFYQEGGWDGFVEILWPFPPIHALENQDNFTLPLIQWLTWLSFITIGVIAIYEPIRRAKYDLFLICHHLTYITLIPAIIWHAQASWEYLLPALSLYLSDRLIRLYRGTQCVSLLPTYVGDYQNMELDYVMQRTTSPFSLHSINYDLPRQTPITSIISPRPEHFITTQPSHHSLKSSLPTTNSSSSSSNITNTVNSTHTATNNLTGGPGVRLINYGDAGKYIELRIDNSAQNFVFFPGHYFFINIAEISLFEWHPMTVSGHVHAQSNDLSFLIKCEGAPTSWTNNLYNYITTIVAKQLPSDSTTLLNIPLTISLDGPYGQPIDFSTNYDNIVLIGGGSGITPLKSVYESLWLSFLHDFIANDRNKSKLQKQLLTQLKFTQDLNNIPSNGTLDFVDSTSDDHGDTTDKNNEIITLPKHVHLFFASKDPALFESMSDSLSHIPIGESVPFTAELICSKNGELFPVQTDKGDVILDSPQYDPKIKVYHNVAHHLSTQRQHDKELDSQSPLERSVCKALGVKSLDEVKNPRRTIFFACGPHRLTTQARDMAIKYGFTQHEEAFEL